MTGNVNIRDCGRDSHSIPSPNRAVSLRLFLCALALRVLLASVASGQILEGQITLPDTLGPLNGPYCLAWDENPGHPRLFVGGVGGFYPGQPPEDSGGVIVAEAITCKRLARIPTGPVKALCYVPIHNKLYVAKLNTDSVEVVDCATNQVVTAVLVAGEVPVIQYNPQNDRLYCGGSSISVIDCAGDSVIHTIAVAATVFALDSIHSKLYAGRDGPLSVIDCASDTVVATIPEIGLDSALCFNPTAGKMYAASGDTLYAIQTGGDSIVDRLSLAGLAPILTCDPQRNRIYCVYGTSFGSIDCAGDTVIMTHAVGQTASFMACDVARDRLYATFPGYWPEAVVYDATGGRYVTEAYVDGIPSGARWCPGLDRLYCLPALQANPPSQSCLLAAVGGANDSMVGFVPLTMWAGSLSVDTVHNRLYFMYDGGVIGCIGTVDCSRNVVIWYEYAGESPGPMCFNPNNNHLYWSTGAWTGLGNSVTVYDCSTNAVIGKVKTSGGIQAVQLHLGLDKLYAYAPDTLGNHIVNVIDCKYDSVTSRIALPDGNLTKLLLVPEDNRLWFLGVRHVIAIDCVGDSIVADAIDNLGSIDDACACPQDRKIYTDHRQVIDMDNPTHVESTAAWGNRFLYDPRASKLYVSGNYGSRSLFHVFDARGDTELAAFYGPCKTSGMCLDHTGNYIYCAGYEDSMMFVIDTRADSVVAAFRVSTTAAARDPLAVNRRTNRIYEAQYFNQAGRGIPVVRDSMLIGLEELKSETRSASIYPTLVSSSAPLHSTTPAGFFDACGRRVAVLRSGLNDISRLAPGVYFVRQELQAASRKPQAVRKVVVTR